MIRVRCVNGNCPAVGVPCEMSGLLLMGHGELVICGVCGSPCEFIGDARPPRHWVDPATINKAQPLRRFRRWEG